MTAPLPGIAIMNIAAADDEALTLLYDFFAKVADHGTEEGRLRAGAYLQAIEEEFTRRLTRSAS